MPSGNTYCFTAEKGGVSYETVKFNVDTADAVEHGVELYYRLAAGFC